MKETDKITLSESEVGSKFLQKFVPLEEIGRGAFGQVISALEVQSAKKFAVKVRDLGECGTNR